MNNYRSYIIKTSTRIPRDEQLLCSAFGLCAQAGEVVDFIKKCFFHNQDFDKNKLLSELGDVFWYLELALHSLNLDLNKSEVIKDFKVDHNILMKLSIKLIRRTSWFADHVSDNKFDGKDLNLLEVKKRLEDVYSCLFYFAIALNSSVEEIKEKNIEKLKIRYPDRFTSNFIVNKEDQHEECD